MDLKDEGLVVASCGVGIYLLAFAYELGQMSFWNMPLEYFSMNMSTLLIIGSAFLVIFIPILFLWLSFINSRSGKKLARIRLFWVIACLASSFVSIFLFRTQWNPFLWGAYVLVLFLIIVVLTLFKNPIPLKKQNNEGNVKDTNDLSNISVIFLVFCIIGLAFFFLGHERGRNQIEFLVPTDTTDVVVLRHYGDNLICAPFDRNTKLVERKFIIRNDANDNIEMAWEIIGPLRMKK